jgi:hypothetical protein
LTTQRKVSGWIPYVCLEAITFYPLFFFLSFLLDTASVVAFCSTQLRCLAFRSVRRLKSIIYFMTFMTVFLLKVIFHFQIHKSVVDSLSRFWAQRWLLFFFFSTFGEILNYIWTPEFLRSCLSDFLNSINQSNFFFPFLFRGSKLCW